jgi:predicted DNA-binding ribbon-helix-helix protein
MSLQQIARGRQMTTPDLVASLDAARENSNLSSATRVFILEHYRAMAGRPDVGFTPLSVIPRAAVAAQSYQWAAMRRSALATDALAKLCRCFAADIN